MDISMDIRSMDIHGSCFVFCLSWFCHICLIWLAGDIKLGNSQIGVTKYSKV